MKDCGIDYSVLRLGSYGEWNKEILGNSLNNLKNSKHNVEAGFNQAPGVVSCVTAVRYLIMQSLSVDIPIFSLQNITRLPYLLLKDYRAECIPAQKAQIGDLVFYFGDLMLSCIQQRDCIKHVGVVIDNEGKFYHSTLSGGGYTISDLFRRIGERRIATTSQLLENR